MTRWRITLLDSVSGEIFVVHEEQTGVPCLTDPYYTNVGRNGYVLKLERCMTPSPENIYR